MVSMKKWEIDLLILLRGVEFHGKLSIDMAENEKLSNWKVPKEVRAAKINEAMQTPQRNPTTQIWNGNELPIFMALWETTLSIDLWFNGSISLLLSQLIQKKLLHPFSRNFNQL